jgi:hypothetical protein
MMFFIQYYTVRTAYLLEMHSFGRLIQISIARTS